MERAVRECVLLLLCIVDFVLACCYYRALQTRRYVVPTQQSNYRDAIDLRVHWFDRHAHPFAKLLSLERPLLTKRLLHQRVLDDSIEVTERLVVRAADELRQDADLSRHRVARVIGRIFAIRVVSAIGDADDQRRVVVDRPDNASISRPGELFDPRPERDSTTSSSERPTDGDDCPRHYHLASDVPALLNDLERVLGALLGAALAVRDPVDVRKLARDREAKRRGRVQGGRARTHGEHEVRRRQQFVLPQLDFLSLGACEPVSMLGCERWFRITTTGRPHPRHARHALLQYRRVR